MPEPLVEQQVQQSAIYGLEPLDFSTLQLDWPSISPFLGDTWWLETMDFTGPTSGPGVGTSGPGVGTSGPGVGTSGPDVGFSGPSIGTSGPGIGTSGPDIGRIYKRPDVNDAFPVEYDPATFGTSGREVGKILESDQRLIEIFNKYPVIVDISGDGMNIIRYIMLHLLAASNPPEPWVLNMLKQFEADPYVPPKALSDWLWNSDYIALDGYGNADVYMGIPLSNALPAKYKANDGNYYYSGRPWSKDFIRKMRTKSEWPWTAWQPEWEYLMLDYIAHMRGGGHLPGWLQNWESMGVPWVVTTPRIWSADPRYGEVLGGWSAFFDVELNLPVIWSSPSIPLFRRYRKYSMPVYTSMTSTDPVLRIDTWVFADANVTGLVYPA